MIILDTNVVSEPMAPFPNPRVVDWLDAQDEANVWITVITFAELRAGIAKLGYGTKRSELTERIEETLFDFDGRILPFEADAAFMYGELAGPLMARKVKIGVLDLQLAAICLVHGATLATRNVKHFVDHDVPLINPWGD